MDIIDELRSQIPEGRLFHYTSLKGVWGIFTSKSIWATDILYLDDTTEYMLAYELVKKKWNNFRDSMGGHIAGAFLVPFWAELKKKPGSHAMGIHTEAVYVCSFSTRDNRIAWEAYGNHGRGYAIGFDYNDLINPMHNQSFFLVPCQYDTEMHSRIIDAFLERARDIFRMTQASFARGGRQIEVAGEIAAKKAYLDFLQVAPMLKSPDWKEDSEWRLISKPIPRSPTTRPYIPSPESHTGGEAQIPYIEFKLQENAKPLQIPEILIGRGLNRDIEELNIKLILDKTCAEVRSIDISNVRYRPFSPFDKSNLIPFFP